MKIITILNDIASENTYILENDQSILLIDPGSNGQEIIKAIETASKPIAAILLTHTHYDHIFSLDLVRERFDWPPVYVSSKEATWLFTAKDNLSGLIRHADIPDVIAKPAENIFENNKTYHIADFTFTLLETPGHSIGGVSFNFFEDEFVITGDALFRESIGRSDLPTGDFKQLTQSIKEKLYMLPNHYTVYPGHGPTTTIGHEKNFNPYLS
ncbi:MBL fold metallo-hydrolase [Streptococcus hongkongensis]|nr:hydrolase [Streptococcus uberis]